MITHEDIEFYRGTDEGMFDNVSIASFNSYEQAMGFADLAKVDTRWIGRKLIVVWWWS